MSQNVRDFLEWLKAGSTIVAAIGVCIAYYQLRKNVRWNKLNATLTYLNSASFTSREQSVAEALAKLDLNYHEDISLNDHVVSICNDPKIYQEVKYFLNTLETNAVAMNMGALDKECAYQLRADYYIRNFRLFKPVIDSIRSKWKSEKYWAEMEKLCNEWIKRKTEPDATDRYK